MAAEQKVSTAVKNPWVYRCLTGKDYLYDSYWTKDTATTLAERKALKCEGLLPPVVQTMQLQVQRAMERLRKYKEPIEKFEFLADLQNTNETLFYRCCLDYTAELMPIVYTPVVGEACIKWSSIFRQPRGMYITMAMKGRIADVLENWPGKKSVRAIVFTDGERILGLGDQGCNGMGIPVGKLCLYTICGGVHPDWCLPVTIDVGTNNKTHLADPLYIGVRKERIRGKEYDELVYEFMEAAVKVFGKNTLLQFEDFGNLNAFRLLENTREKFCTFNDDIQGTASVIVAGLIAGLPLTGMKNVIDHTFLFYGAGEAAIGIGNLIALLATQEKKISMEEARKKIWMIDSKGLVVKDRKCGGLSKDKLDFAHPFQECTKLEEIIHLLKPTALIGVGAIPQVFTEPVVKAMHKYNKRPIIFALSNPTSKAECTAKQAYEWTNGDAIYASGSPFDPVTIGTKTYIPGQGNNSYIFPGLAMGILCAGAKHVTDEMILQAAKALSKLVTPELLESGCLYPPLSKIRWVSEHIAAEVMDKCYEQNLATLFPRPKDLKAYAASQMYQPEYPKFTDME